MLNFNCKRKTVFLLLILFSIISLLTALIAVSINNVNIVYADTSAATTLTGFYTDIYDNSVKNNYEDTNYPHNAEAKITLYDNGNLYFHFTLPGNTGSETNNTNTIEGKKVKLGLLIIKINDIIVFKQNSDDNSNINMNKKVDVETTISTNNTIYYNTNYKVEIYFYYQWNPGGINKSRIYLRQSATLNIPNTTKPTGTLSGVENGGITNKNVKFTWAEDNCSATLDGNNYEKNTIISSEGNHTIILKNSRTGNSSTYTFAIDKTPPKGTLIGVSNGGATNSDVSFTWAEDNCTATLNGANYSKNAKISGTSNSKTAYTLILKDISGNTTTYTFTIDKTPPNFTIKDENNNTLNTTAIINKNVYVEWSSSQLGTLSIKRNNGNYITEYHTTYYYDSFLPLVKWFNKADLSENIKSKEKALVQTITYSGGNVAEEDKNDAVVGNTAYKYNNLYYFKQQTLDKAINQTVNIRLITIDKWYLTEEGVYIFTFTNHLGTQTSKTITIDKTAPTGTLSGVSNGGITNKNVSFTWTEDNCTATLNGANYQKNSVIYSPDGKYENYTLILKDRAGNTTTYNFSIDRESPTGTLSGVSNGGITNKNVSFTWTEDNCSATLNGANYSKNTAITTEGNFTIILKDRFENKTTYTFTIDKTAPTGTLSGVSNGGITNKNVSFTWNEQNATATLNSGFYQKNSIIENEGQYTIVITDTVGNSRTYTFTIDKTPPKGMLNGVENGGITGGKVSFTWSDSRATATLNGQNYLKDTIIEGEYDKKIDYVIILTDTAGNSTTYSFSINKILPKVEFYKDGILFNIPYQSEFFVNENIMIKYTNKITIKVNGNVLPNSSSESTYFLEANQGKEILYEIELISSMGIKNNYNIIIDKKLPTENLNYFLAKGKNFINHWWETYNTSLADDKYVITNYYSFANYISAKNFAMEREQKQFEEGTYDGSGKIYCQVAKKYVDGFDIFNPKVGQKFIIYKDANNANKLIAYFNNSNLITAQQAHSERSIKENFVPASPNDEFYENTVFIKEIFLPGNEFGFEFTLKNCEIFYTHNPSANENDFIKTNYNVKFTAGYTKILEVDKAGNKVTYIIYLDNEPPHANAVDADNNFLVNLTELLNGERDTIYWAAPFTLFIDDTLDLNSVLCISNNNTIIKRIFTQENSFGFSFDNSGIYEIEWYDKVGNKKTKTLYLAIEEIKVSFVETKDTNHSVVGFEMQLDKINKFNNIEGITIEFTSLDGNTFMLSPSTTPSFDFIADKLNYNFNINGTYKITVADSFGRNTNYEYMLQKDLPVGKIYDKATNTELANKSTIGGPIYLKNGHGVYFTWEDDTLSCEYSINDGNLLPYTANTLLTGIDGQLIKISFYLSSDNLTSQYTIFIDLEPLDIICDGVEKNAATNKNVTLSWNSTSKGSVSVKYKNQTAKRILNYTTFSESGNYSVVSTDEFGNTYSFEFTIDKNAPGILVYTKTGSLINGLYTNKDFYFTWGGENVTATLNGSLYEENSVISQDGNYTLIIIDYLGNSSTVNIIKDTVLKDAIFTGLNDNNWANDVVTAIWTENDITATLNGQIYHSGDIIDTPINTKSEFTLFLKDTAGNTKTYNFIISRVLPKGTLNGVENGDITKNNVSFSWLSSFFIASLNEEEYLSGTIIKDEGYYELILTDTRNNNINIYTFTIDKTPPEGELIGVENGGTTNTDVSFSWTEAGASATLNGQLYNPGELISESGTYIIVLNDAAGNTKKYNFSIDKIAPKGELIGVENGGTTNTDVLFRWSENNCTATLNGQFYTSGEKIKESGKYTIILLDKTGNSSLYTFVIDKSLPFAQFYNEEKDIIADINNKRFNVNIIIEIEERFTATLNGGTYLSGTPITEEGEYELVVLNFLGNKIIYNFTIDKTPPKGTLNGVENGGITNKNVNFTWTESRTTCIISTNNSSDYVEYNSGTLLRETGFYIIILTDAAGNISEYSFTILKDKPLATSVGLNDNNYSKDNVVFYFSEDFTATLNGGTYLSGTPITEEGEYELIVYNCIKDYTTYTFTIDKTAPIVYITNKLDEIIHDTFISVPFYIRANENCNIKLNNSLYTNEIVSINNNYTIIASDQAGNSSIVNLILNSELPTMFFNVNLINGKTSFDVILNWVGDDSVVTINGNNYEKNTIISSEGFYKAEIQNKYGAKNTYTFTIDKTPPNYTIVGVENGGITNKNVKIDFNSSYNSYYIINKDEDTTFDYNPNDLIEGKNGEITYYEVTITNNLGATLTITFTIDKTSPEGELIGVENGGTTNTDVSFSWTEAGISATLNGEEYLSGTIITIPINSKLKFELVLSNSIGNKTTYTFTINKIIPLPYTKIPDKIITKDFSVKFAEEIAATLNGQPYKSGELISESGTYMLILTDYLGNSSFYEFTIDKEDLSFVVNMNDENISVEKDTTFNYAISIITDKKFTVNGVEQQSGYTLDIAGVYEITIISDYGTTATYKIKLIPPPAKYSTGDIIVFILLGCIGISLIIGFSIVVFKTVKTNKKKII